MHNNEYEVLLEAAEREASVLNDRKTASTLYVRAARAAGDDENAALALERALELDPESTAAARDLRACLARTGDIDRLTELLARAANSCVDKLHAASVWRQVAALYGDAQGNLAGAISALERAMRLAPDGPTCWGDLADVLKRDGQFTQAASLLARVTDRSSDTALTLRAHTELAFLNEEHLGQPGTAIHHLRAAVKLSPNNTGLLLRLSDLLSRSEQHADALTMAHRLLDLGDTPSTRVGALLHIARVEGRRGDVPGMVRDGGGRERGWPARRRGRSHARGDPGSGVTAADLRARVAAPHPQLPREPHALERGVPRARARAGQGPERAQQRHHDAGGRDRQQPGSLPLRT